MQCISIAVKKKQEDASADKGSVESGIKQDG